MFRTQFTYFVAMFLSTDLLIGAAYLLLRRYIRILFVQSLVDAKTMVIEAMQMEYAALHETAQKEIRSEISILAAEVRELAEWVRAVQTDPVIESQYRKLLENESAL